MDFDLATVIFSATLSAMVSALVSLATASLVTGRQERARRRLEARHKVRDAIAQTYVAGRVAARGLEVPNEQLRQPLIKDYELASQMLAAAEELSWVRRLVVHRRLRRVVGRFAFDTARDLPAADDRESGHTLAMGIMGDANKERYDLHQLGGLRRRAFNDGEPDQTALAKLNKQLSLIARCR